VGVALWVKDRDSVGRVLSVVVSLRLRDVVTCVAVY
jgi:hypothetical protein